MSPEDIEVVDTPDGVGVAVSLDAFAGDTADERMTDALLWAERMDCPVVIDKGDAVLTEINVWSLRGITIVGTPL